MSPNRNLESMARDIPSYTNPDPRAVAIIGMSINAPAGLDHGIDTEEFYRFLQNRGSGIITVPSDRWNADAFHGTGPGKIGMTKGGFIPDLRYGDPQEFSITSVEAHQMGTSQMLLLHQAFNALQRSGVDYRGTNTGVYIGATSGEALFEMDIYQAGAYYITGTTNSITANRINYVFDLLGPSMPVDTACSSSLVAMHLATQAIRNGECDQAVVAGVNAIRSVLDCASFSQLGVLSPDGVSRSFDEDGNGYARADVASAVVIKRHDLAVRDFNRIHATLVGTALTSCGSIMGSLTTPNPAAQEAAIRLSYRDAGLQPHQADFVELHGTGTVVGDSTEANLAGAVFSEGRNGREILMGSVKSNVGHGELGHVFALLNAYMTSLIKVVMMLENKQVLPNGYFKKPSSRIDFEGFDLRVPVAVEDFVPADPTLGRIASISSYGFGGAGGHTVLREHEPRPSLPGNITLPEPLYIFAVGGLSPKGCSSLVDKYKEDYADVAPLALCEHLGNRARQLTWRTFAVAESIQAATFPESVLVPKRPNPVILCFSGQGPQHWKQGRELYYTFKVFRDSIVECDRVHMEYTGESFLQKTGLFRPDPPMDSPLATSLMWPSDITSIALTFFQIALFDLLVSLGLKPDAVVGHSVGETAVLYASGAVPRSMAVKLAVARGKALATVDNTGGGMVVISGCDTDKVRNYAESATVFAGLDEGPPQLFLASFNSPHDTGVSGAEKHVDAFVSFIKEWVGDVTAHKLRINTAVHSPFVDPCETQFRRDLEAIFAEYPGPHVPTTITMSTVTADFKVDSYTPDYLWNNLRQPVLFSSAIPKIIERFGESTVFVEVSPHPVLSQYINSMGALDSLPASRRPPSLRHLKPGSSTLVEVHTLLEVLGNLLLQGVNSFTARSQINFSELTGYPDVHFEGPAYPFNRKHWRFGMDEPTYICRLLPKERPLNSMRLRVSPVLPEPWIGDHVIDNTNLIPAAAYLEMGLEFPDVTHLYDCRFPAMYVLDESGPPGTLEVSHEGNSWWVKSSSQMLNPQGDMDWTRVGPAFDVLHARGKLGYGPVELGPDAITHVDVDALLARCTHTFDGDSFASMMVGLAQFGPEFRRVLKVCCNENEALAYVRGHVEGVNRTDYAFHPALLDAIFQSCGTWEMMGDKLRLDSKDGQLLLPHSVKRIFRNDGSGAPLVLPEQFMCYSILQEWSPERWVADLRVLGEDHSVIFTVEGLRFELVQQHAEWPNVHYKMLWQPRDLPQLNLEGLIVLPDHTTQSDAEEVLKALDQLAVHYTRQTLVVLPRDFTPISHDRKLYLDWAQALIKNSQESANIVSIRLQEKYEALFELTRQSRCRAEGPVADIMVAATAEVEQLVSNDIMSKVYEHPPFVGSVFDETVVRFLDLVKNAMSSGKQVVRILEVGANTGRLTALLGRALLEANLPDGFYVDYVCSDINIYRAQEAISKCPWPTVTAKALDLNVPVSEQHLDPRSFDIVVAFDVLHTAPDIHVALVTIKDLLCSGGHAVVLELDANSFASAAIGTTWMNFIFGSFQEWFGVLESRTGSIHCTLGASQWKDALVHAGFSDTLLLTSASTAVAHLAFITQSTGESLSTRHLQLGNKSRKTTSSASSSLPPLPPYSEVDSRLLNESFVPLTVEKTTGVTGDYDPAEQQLSASTRDAAEQNVIVRHFTAGGEVALVDFISSLDSTHPYILWLHTDMAASNAAVLGLTRTLRQEYPAWTIYVAMFPCSWNTAEQEAYVRLQLLPLPWVDSEVMIDEKGTIRVPRIVKAPSSRMELRGSNPVEFLGTDVWRAYSAEIGPNDVEVSVQYIGLSVVVPTWTEFVGQVTAVGTGVADRYIVGRRVFGATNSPQGNVIICNRAKLAVVPDNMDTTIAAALVGRLVFLSLVVVEVARASSKKAKVLLHAGECTPAAIATYAFLHASGFDVTVSVSDASTPHDALGADPPFTSSRYHTWTSYLRTSAPHGVDIVFNFDEDKNVAKQTMELLSPRGKFVQIGGESPSSLPSGRQYISVDYDTIAAEDNCLDRTLEIFVPAVIAALSPSLDIYDLSQLAVAEARSRLSSTGNRTVLIDLQVIDAQLSVLKGGVVEGTHAFNPRASYVVIGGIGGLGLNIARCLVDNGAKHVILTSRSGESAFTAQKLAHEKKLLKHLQAIEGVTIDLRAVDVLDGEKTKDLFSSLEHPVAVYDVKIKGVEVLLEAVNPRSLDFLVLTSSMATVFGSPGQTNYAAAQTYMEALVADLPNTVAITVPPITDGGIFVRSLPPGKSRNAALDKYKNLGMTGYRVAQHCVDAIWTLNSDAYNSVYIPPSDWKEVMNRPDIVGIPDYNLSSLRHLLAKENIESSSTGKEWSIRAALAAVLALDQNEIMDNVPLSNYGLDSLTSVRLSGILKTDFGMNVTQLQLLGNAMTVLRLTDLQEQHLLAASSTTLEIASGDTQVLGIEGVHEVDLDQTVVRLNNVTDGRPLFLIHGAGGGVLVMLKTAEMISCPVYGVQDTPEAPIHGTLERLAAFYLQKIKEKQPTGPYRLGGFSFGTYLALVIAQMLQQTGETVELLIMIDGSPAFMSAIRDLSASGTLDNGEELGAMFASHFEQVSQGTSSSKFAAQFARAYFGHVLMGIRASIEALGREQAGKSDNAAWPAARTIVIRASKGTGSQAVAEGLSAAFDVDLYVPDVVLYELAGTHFGILNPKSGLPQLLEEVLSH
ncbi:polyketide synthase [Melanogaster broomeanus]|nr:polyketide synthase [Melanogaster broomeanus]